MCTEPSQADTPSIDVVFCTYQRLPDLRRSIESLLAQTRPPAAIVIVDNSNDALTAQAAGEMHSRATEKGIAFRFLRNDKENSLTVARNLGVEACTSDIVLFLDDDIELDSNYVEELTKHFQQCPTTVAAQGYLRREAPTIWKNLVRRLIGEFHFRRDVCCSLPSISTSYPYPCPAQPIPCNFLSGANHAARRWIYRDFRYDEKLTKYADGEDLDMGLRIARAYPNRTWLVPTARLHHHNSAAGRMPSQELVTMQEVYGLYLLAKFYSGQPAAWLYFMWNRLCRTAIRGILALGGSEYRRAHFIATIEAHMFCLRRYRQIIGGDLRLSFTGG